MAGLCRECAFSKLREQMGVKGLYCHERSASMQIVPNGQGGLAIFGLWPPVDANDTCARFTADPMSARANSGAILAAN